jgi:uncharacterized membrane protein YfcA
MKKFLFEHSLSIGLTIGAVICAFLGYRQVGEADNFWMDFWVETYGSFIGNVFLLLLARFLWERNADPSQPPS